MGKIIGIDFGTTNSAASIIIAGKPEIVYAREGSNVAGDKAFPSVVFFEKYHNSGDEFEKIKNNPIHVVIGEPARKRANIDPESAVREVKRELGTDKKYTIHRRKYRPQQISAYILQKIKQDAEQKFGKITKAVISVPAFYNDNQKQATKDAAEIAGLEVVDLISEPNAAALAFSQTIEREMKVMVFDFGGGTLDVSIVNLSKNEKSKIALCDVLATSGDTSLGGIDMDEKIIEFVYSEFERNEEVKLPSKEKNKRIWARIREEVERAKIQLSSEHEVEIICEYLYKRKHLDVKLTRNKLEELVKPIIERCKLPIYDVLVSAGLSREDIDKIILVGGPTRMPVIRELIHQVMGKYGESGVDPIEAVSIGAAIQADLIAKGDSNVVLDVIPQSLGLELANGSVSTLVKRNSTIPTFTEKTYNMPKIAGIEQARINVVQGEQNIASKNVSLGVIRLPMKTDGKEIGKIKVKFDLDKDGILSVTAVDINSNKQIFEVFENFQKLTQKEIKKFKKQTEEQASFDKSRIEKASLNYEAETSIRIAEKLIQDEIQDTISEDEKQQVFKLTSNLRSLISDEADINNLELFKEKINLLNSLVVELKSTQNKDITEIEPSSEAVVEQVEDEAEVEQVEENRIITESQQLSRINELKQKLEEMDKLEFEPKQEEFEPDVTTLDSFAPEIEDEPYTIQQNLDISENSEVIKEEKKRKFRFGKPKFGKFFGKIRK